MLRDGGRIAFDPLGQKRPELRHEISELTRARLHEIDRAFDAGAVGGPAAAGQSPAASRSGRSRGRISTPAAA